MTAVATERVVVLMPPNEKAQLTAMARQAGVSIGEFVRRLVRDQASDAELQAELERRRPEVEALLDELEASSERAHAALDAALAAVEETRRYLSKPWSERAAS
jgi:Ribbon-helix-helix protein, copG family